MTLCRPKPSKTPREQFLGLEVHFSTRHENIRQFSASLDSAKQALGSNTIALDELWGTFCLLALSPEFAGVRAVIDYETPGKPQPLSAAIPKVLQAPVPESKARPHSQPKAHLTQNKGERCPHKYDSKACYKCNPCDACKAAGYAYTHTPDHPAHCTVKIRSSQEPNKGPGVKAYSAVSSCSNEHESWILDSGATDHMARSSMSFTQYFPCNRQILTASSDAIGCPGMGSCSFSSGIHQVEFGLKFDVRS
jgi:hypothetical protein